eukprot:RCo032022
MRPVVVFGVGFRHACELARWSACTAKAVNWDSGLHLPVAFCVSYGPASPSVSSSASTCTTTSSASTCPEAAGLPRITLWVQPPGRERASPLYHCWEAEVWSDGWLDVDSAV